MNKIKYMGVSVEQAAVVPRAKTQRERVIVQWDDGRHEGGVVDWGKRFVVINKELERCLNTDGLWVVRPTHLLLYDNGELTPVAVKAGGWLRDGDAHSHQTGPQGVCGPGEEHTPLRCLWAGVVDPAGTPQSHCKPVVHPSNVTEYSATTHT